MTVTIHDFRISWGKRADGAQEMGEVRLTRDCMQSGHVRAKCTRLLKKLLKGGDRDIIYYVRFSNQTLGISDTISGYNGKQTRQWDS